MTSPVPGVTYPFPRTWSAGDEVTVPRLRGDLVNMLALSYGNGLPLLQAGFNGTLPNGHGTVNFTSAALNNWNVNVVTPTFSNGLYLVPFAGWYLATGLIRYEPYGTQSSARWVTGFTYTQGGTLTSNTDGGGVLGAAASGYQFVGQPAAELAQLNPGTSDGIGLYGYQTSGGSQLAIGNLTVQWAGLPTSGLSSYTGPYGSVVTGPQPAAAWPPGEGTTLTGTISAGGTVASVASAAGITAGQKIGLGYLNSAVTTDTAETVTVESVSGLTLSISAAAYGHSDGEAVAVPVSAAFLNQQCRDAVNFLAYPPMLRATAGTAQSIPSGSLASPTQITNLSAAATGCIDNFSGFASSAYTVQVGGVYLVYGQAYYAGSSVAASEYGCGIQVNSGTVQWGTVTYSDSIGASQAAVSCPVLRRLRLSAGQTVSLWGFQSSGSAMDTVVNTTGGRLETSRLLMVFQAF